MIQAKLMSKRPEMFELTLEDLMVKLKFGLTQSMLMSTQRVLQLSMVPVNGTGIGSICAEILKLKATIRDIPLIHQTLSEIKD